MSTFSFYHNDFYPTQPISILFLICNGKLRNWLGREEIIVIKEEFSITNLFVIFKLKYFLFFFECFQIAYQLVKHILINIGWITDYEFIISVHLSNE
jgi:hypothetical protein